MNPKQIWPTILIIAAATIVIAVAVIFRSQRVERIEGRKGNYPKPAPISRPQ